MFRIGVLEGALLLCGASVLGACSDPAAAPRCVDTVCAPGASRCAGNHAATCAGDGLAWTTSACGNGLACDGGVCKPRKCTNLGAGSCADELTVILCSATGDAQTTQSCKGGEVCRGGSCVPTACTDGTAQCGSPSALLECTGGAWTVKTCSAGQACFAVAGGKPACQPRACEPESARCEGEVSLLCNGQGTAAAETPCAANELCRDGFCGPKVCGKDDLPDAVADASGVQDGTGADPGPVDAKKEVFIPPLEPIKRLEFKWNGETKKFDLNAFAKFVASEKNLKISAAGGMPPGNIEINIAPIEPFTVGKWTDTDGSEVGIQICYYDGLSPETTVDPCSVGFSHASIAYTVDLATNNGPVKGTFSATLKDGLGQTYELTEGVIDVLTK